MSVQIVDMRHQRWLCPSRYSFFGLGSDYRPVIYDQIFDLMYFGKMGFTYTELYHMPVFQRRYYYTKLGDYLKKQNEAEQAAVNKAKKGR